MTLSIVKSQVGGTLTIQSMDDLARLSEMMAKSGFFEDCKSAAQAGVKIMCGLELGIPAFASLTGIHLIKGKPTIGANIMAALIKKSGRYNYRVLEHTDQVCRIAFYEGKEQIGVSEFTATDAQRMGTQNMNKFPKNMLFARAISNGIKFHCPDLFLGAPVYTPEELGAEIDEEGEIVTLPVAAASVVQPDVNQARLKALQARTGQADAQIMDIAAKQRINPEGMSSEEFIRLRNALYAAWGSEQEGAFKAPKHAWNSYQQLLKDLEPEASDQEIWEAWQLEIAERIGAASSVEVVAEEF
jgi:hypothetical protein